MENYEILMYGVFIIVAGLLVWQAFDASQIENLVESYCSEKNMTYVSGCGAFGCERLATCLDTETHQLQYISWEEVNEKIKSYANPKGR
jgi:hypothetical protein